MIYYFAYGSNLHPLRLTERVSSAKLVGGVHVTGYQLKFHKQGQDDSGKCNLLHTGIASDIVHGAIYTLAAGHKRLLDEFEGKGLGYIDGQINILHQSQKIRCFTYLAQEDYIIDSLKPYHWYKQLVIHGARYLKFPDSYLSGIESIESLEDPEIDRRQNHDELLARIHKQIA